MKEWFKVSGKRVELPQEGQWTFSRRPGGWVIAESPTDERRKILLAEVRGKLSASVGGRLWHGEVTKDQRVSARNGGGSDADLTAQFPGKVRKLLVAEGAKVAEGEALLLVEAMKMEFAIKAPYAGVVKRVLVSEAQQLSPGDRFVELVAEPNGSQEAAGG